MNEHNIQRALLSVSDKTGIVSFAQFLRDKGVEILSTGGTASLLRRHEVEVVDVAEYTGFPEIMDGRVKTLHPKIYAGILRRPDIDADILQQYGLPPIDLVVVNLYPFAETIRHESCDLETAIENIDIGGPCLLRAAAKNHAHTLVITDPDDYEPLQQELEAENMGLSRPRRLQLAQKAFAHTAQYDQTIAHYFSQQSQEDNTASLLPEHHQVNLTRLQTLRYGENPHQLAAFYRIEENSSGNIANAKQLQGKALSYNNIADADAALECVKTFAEMACVIVKHANPCGVAIAATQCEAYQAAYATDPTSAFGGIIAFNRLLEAETAQAILGQQFVEVIIAPQITSQAQAVLAAKPNIRVLAYGAWSEPNAKALDYKRVGGGMLVQTPDLEAFAPEGLKVVTRRQPTPEQYQDLCFAWQVVHFVKSNAIVYAKEHRTYGIGAGQMSRIDSTRIAALKANDAELELTGAVMASDAFFPFRDTVDAAAKAGIKAIIQPGGSIRDPEVIAAADEADLAMILTHRRHFRH